MKCCKLTSLPRHLKPKIIFENNKESSWCGKGRVDNYHDDDELLLVDVVLGDRVLVDHDLSGVDQLLAVHLELRSKKLNYKVTCHMADEVTNRNSCLNYAPSEVNTRLDGGTYHR